MTTEITAQAQRGSGHCPSKHDIIGIILGVPISLLGLGALGALPAAWWIGLMLMLTSVGLFVPGRLCERGKARAVGFAALAPAITLAASCAVILAWGAYDFISDPPENGEMRWIMAAVTMFWCLIALVLVGSGIWVLLKKIRPRPIHLAIVVTIGIAAGLLLVMLMMLP